MRDVRAERRITKGNVSYIKHQIRYMNMYTFHLQGYSYIRRSWRALSVEGLAIDFFQA
jgi:hypothetical protein